MQILISLSFLFTNYLVIECQSNTWQQPKILLFQYYSRSLRQVTEIRTTAFIINRYQANSAFHLIGKLISQNKLQILGICCKTDNCRQCSDILLVGSYIVVEQLMNNSLAVKIESHNRPIKLLSYLHSIINDRKNLINFTCTVENTNDNSKGSPEYPISKTGLFGIIFLSSCVVLTFALCIGWFAVIYYRQFTHRRMKSNIQKALARSVQQMLDKSPIIIFDSKNKDNDCIDDDDPMCAICLESFIDAERVRKLVCSHHFHVTCIDPWLLSHQCCPLCNRNILRNSIPSISSRILQAIGEPINQELVSNDTPVVINNNITIVSQYPNS